MALAAAVFLASVALPALGAPRAVTAASVASKVRHALGLAKQADKDSKRALHAAKQHGDGVAGIGGDPGPPGDPGDPGDAGNGGAPGQAGNNGSTGSNGAPGANGSDGDDGAPGFDGIPRKATGVLDAPTETSGGTPVAIPLDGAAWTQASDETDLVFAVVDVVDDGCVAGSAVINLYLGADNTGPLLLSAETNGGTTILAPTGSPSGPAAIFETGSSEHQVLYMEASDSCSGGDFLINSVDVSVVGLS